MSGLHVALPDELVEAVARRAAALVLEELAAGGSSGAGPYLSVHEAAELLRAKPQRVYDLLSSGRLTRLKDGSRVLVERAEIEAMLRAGGVAQALPTGRRSRMAARGVR